jgi:hypothetical protein
MIRSHLRLAAAVRKLIGQECWSIIGVPAESRYMSVHFDRVPRERKSKNRNLTKEQQSYEGRFILFVGCCWRIVHRSIVTSSASEENPGRRVPRGKRARPVGSDAILGSRVTRVRLGAAPTPDLTILFANGARFEVICDQVDDERDDYVFFDERSTYCVRARGVIDVKRKRG